MLDQSFNLPNSNVLDAIFQLPTLAVESGLGRSDTITPILPKAVKGMDSSLFSSSVEEYRQGLENRWQSSQSLSSWTNNGDFLTGQSSFVGVSSPVDLAGNTLATARAITVGSSTTSYTDWVGSTDTNDYYRFSLANSANFNLSLTGMTADADVQLLNSGGSVIASSTLGGTASESITSQLSAGTYYIRVYPYSGNTNYNLAVSATGGDWFSQNLRDAGLISTARSLAADGNFSRNDMISIFRNAEDGSVIDATELTDLRTIVSNASRFAMQDSVVFLSNCIANGNTANQWWTGGGSTRQTLGNLYAGSSATQMERLIGKWFLGLDRPTAASGTTYRSCSGSLIQSGVSYQDVNQGNLGDCYLLASLAGTAYRTPSTIQNMFTDNGDGTFTVRFLRNGVANYVTVDRYLPTTASGSFYYANRDRGLLYNNTGNELWVALAERAYAQINESGWIGQDNTNSYAGIAGGWPDTTVQQITGRNTVRDYTLDNSDRTAVINAFNAGRIVFLNWASHALTLVGYNPTTQLFTVHNPWGHTDNFTWNQIINGTGTGHEQRFTDWSYTTT
ncbi:MAG: peptidase C2 calpain [Microcystis novacekii Mn_MB_F_20050700_S1D]|uniref:Peptidase C2 calpain n=1 Tax=Microcystis novacekii Mn_MB_F_20050700_S1D TaxID=2486266 RepID=A0A552IHL8_9CHRO|nr:MAG: peptidase C2 calpain [Microcystis novacekii Mn_MB_F_20050700_S1D]